jgi:hypothetical protein
METALEGKQTTLVQEENKTSLTQNENLQNKNSTAIKL